MFAKTARALLHRLDQLLIQRRAASPIYAFTVTWLALVLLGLVILRPSGEEFRCRATVWQLIQLEEMELGNSASDETSAGSILGRVTGDEYLREAMSQLASYKGREISSEEIEAVRGRLRVAVRTPAAGLPQIAIEYTGRDAANSIALVNRLAHLLVARPTDPRRRAAEQAARLVARWDVKEAEHYERKARYELENFLDEHFRHFGMNVAGGPVDLPADGALTRESVVRSAAFVGGAPGADLAELAALRQRRDELLLEQGRLTERFTPAHPRVRELAAEIEEVERRLQAASEVASAPALPSNQLLPEARASESTRDAGSGGGAGPSLRQLAEASATCESLLAECRRATLNREEAVRTTREPLSEGSTSSWLVQPALEARRVVAPFPAIRVFTLCTLALAIAAVVAHSARARHGARLVYDSSETMGGEIVGLWRNRGAITTLIIFSAEMSLLGFVLVFFLLALVKSPLTWQLVEAPLITIGETIPQIVRGNLWR